jgi:aryl-alcohol dehydrogenase-like predicted oxidoreductase
VARWRIEFPSNLEPALKQGEHMKYGHIEGVDKSISRLVQGTIMFSTAEEEYSFDLLDTVFEAGINTFDCGHIYGGGDCERVLGRWIEDRGVRKEVVILT